MTKQIARGLVILLLVATFSQPAGTEDPRVLVFNVPTGTISEYEVTELAEAALGDYPERVRIVFKDVLFEDAPYTSGVFRRAERTIELRSNMTYKGVRYILVHEVAHALTEGHDEDPHGPSWCETYVALLNELLPEYAEQQTRFVGKHYGC